MVSKLAYSCVISLTFLGHATARHGFKAEIRVKELLNFLSTKIDDLMSVEMICPFDGESVPSLQFDLNSSSESNVKMELSIALSHQVLQNVEVRVTKHDLL